MMNNSTAIVSRFASNFNFMSPVNDDAEKGLLETLLDVANGHTCRLGLLHCEFPSVMKLSRHKSQQQKLMLNRWISDLTKRFGIPFNVDYDFTKDYKGYIITMSPSIGITPSQKPSTQIVDLDDALDDMFENTFELDLKIYPIAAVA